MYSYKIKYLRKVIKNKNELLGQDFYPVIQCSKQNTHTGRGSFLWKSDKYFRSNSSKLIRKAKFKVAIKSLTYIQRNKYDKISNEFADLNS